MSPCNGDCSSCGSACSDPQHAINEAMGQIKHVIVILSGKGGVGKSSVAVNLAVGLAGQGKAVGLLDTDIHGPSIPTMLHLSGESLQCDDQERIIPLQVGSLKVMSPGFLIEREDTPLIMRGPMKIGVIQDFLGRVRWGALDYLIIDSPPGTGDEPLSVCQMIPQADGALIVTTPQAVAAVDVAKSISFCNEIGIKVLGLVENMAGFVCPDCGKLTPIFAQGHGDKLAEQYQLKRLAQIPIDPQICESGDNGVPFVHQHAETPAGKAYQELIQAILERE